MSTKYVFSRKDLEALRSSFGYWNHLLLRIFSVNPTVRYRLHCRVAKHLLKNDFSDKVIGEVEIVLISNSFSVKPDCIDKVLLDLRRSVAVINGIDANLESE